MQVLNRNNDMVLAEDAETADNIFKRMKGLLGRSGMKRGEAMILRDCISVHTFFMKFPIDVVFVDKDNRVVKAISRLKPWRVTRFYPRASFCIELPAGTIPAAKVGIGTFLKFI